VLCCVVLCCVALCCVVLCCVVLCSLRTADVAEPCCCSVEPGNTEACFGLCELHENYLHLEQGRGMVQGVSHLTLNTVAGLSLG